MAAGAAGVPRDLAISIVVYRVDGVSGGSGPLPLYWVLLVAPPVCEGV